LRYIEAIKIIQEYKTQGSSPLKIVGDDDQLYVAKFTTSRQPYLELINEVICGGLAMEWDLNVPEMVIISIPPEVVVNFNYSSRYKPEHFKHYFFGSKLFEPAFDFENYIKGVSKSEYRIFINPVDLLKIGCFDHWIGNKDRRPENPNILIIIDPGTQKLQFSPIDHTAAFAYLPYMEVRDIMLKLNRNIMQCGFIKSIIKYEEKKELENLSKNIEICIASALENIDEIFDQVPKEWGFSKKARAHLKTFLSDQERNKRIASMYFNYLKK
jgi:hypothetical protein